MAGTDRELIVIKGQRSSEPGGVMRGTSERGFTLIELMITVAVVAILVTIAYASYQSFVIKSRRSAAQACLMQTAQLMERHYTTALSYAAAPAPAGACITELTGFYAFSFVGAPTASAFQVQAVPTAAQPDSKCGTMTVNQTGNTTPTTSGCW